MSTPIQSSHRRRTFWFVAFGLALVIAVVVAVLQSQTPGSSDPASSAGANSLVTATGGPTGGQVPPAPSVKATAGVAPPMPGTPVPTAKAAPASPDGQKQIAADGAVAFVKQAAQTLVTTDLPTPEAVAAVAAGSAYDGILAAAAEFESNGWRQEGQPVILAMNVISYDEAKDPNLMTLGVCVDSSKVNVLTAQGTVVRAGSAADRSLNILTMTRDTAGKWLVGKLSFPDDPNC